MVNIQDFIELLGEEVEDLMEDFIEYIGEFYVGPDHDAKMHEEVIEQF